MNSFVIDKKALEELDEILKSDDIEEKPKQYTIKFSNPQSRLLYKNIFCPNCRSYKIIDIDAITNICIDCQNKRNCVVKKEYVDYNCL